MREYELINIRGSFGGGEWITRKESTMFVNLKFSRIDVGNNSTDSSLELSNKFNAVLIKPLIFLW